MADTISVGFVRGSAAADVAHELLTDEGFEGVAVQDMRDGRFMVLVAAPGDDEQEGYARGLVRGVDASHRAFEGA